MGGTGAEQLDSLRWRKFPVNFLYHGYFDTYSAYGRGSYGCYWSSTAFNGYNSYILRLDKSSVYPGTRNQSKNVGYSIRCVADS